jgi:hypothetical protein
MIDSIGLALFDDDFRHIATNIEFSPYKEGTIANDSLQLTQTEAQRLMDELWTCGLRPSEGSGSAGAVAATQEHLKDMRRLVFESLAIGKAKTD